MGGAALGSSLVIGTGAFSSVDADRGMTVEVVEDPDAYLGMDRCHDANGNAYPNGDYVNLKDGLLSIDLSDSNPNVSGDGVNAEAITEINNVFQICNQGTQDVCISLEFDPVLNETVGEDAVQIFREPDRVRVGPDRDDGAFLLSPGECTCFSLWIDTRGIHPGDNIGDNLFNEITNDGEELRIIAAAEDSHIYETPPCYRDPDFPQTEQKIYLTNSGDENPGTRLLTVEELDDGTNEATLNSLGWLPEKFEQVDSMAITPDLETLYFYDKNSGHLGRNDTPFPTNPFEDVGSVDKDPGGIVLGEFIPGDDGPRLIAVSQDDDTVYEVMDYKTGSPYVDEIGDTGINVGGSDIEWVQPDEELYLHSSYTTDLYTVDTATGDATFESDLGEELTGTALGETGDDKLIGSVPTSDPGEIIRFDLDGTIIARYDMKLDGDDYHYEYGDMASGVSRF